MPSSQSTPTGSRLKKLQPSDMSKMVEMYASGYTTGQIGVSLGVSQANIWSHLSRRGIKMRPQTYSGEESHFFTGGVKDEAAKIAIREAVARRDIIPSKSCENCGVIPPPFRNGSRGIQGHHDDYNFPLKVRWLCRKCHLDWHRKNTPIAKVA